MQQFCGVLTDWTCHWSSCRILLNSTKGNLHVERSSTVGETETDIIVVSVFINGTKRHDSDLEKC